MPIFDPTWFDIISIFSREGQPGQLSVHVFKQPHTCEQFFIPRDWLDSPTLWQDIHDKAVEIWNKQPAPQEGAVCPNCGTTRRNWQRWYQGRAFCGFCGRDIEDPDKTIPQKLKVSRGNYSLTGE